MPPKIFISYSHADEKWKDRLREFLDVEVMLNNLIVWDDREIRTGEEWNEDIEKAILDSDIALLLVTTHFLKSSFIQNYEIPFIKKKNLKIMPIIISPCSWEKFDYIEKTQGFTKNNQPLEGLSEFKTKEEFTRISNELCRFNLVNRVAKKESIDLKKLLKNYLQNITPLKEAMLNYIPSYSLHYENIEYAYSFDELFDVLLKEIENGYIYCILKALNIKEIDLESYKSRKCKKNNRNFNRVFLLVELDSNKKISACNIDIWYILEGKYEFFDNLKNINFRDKRDYERKLSKKLIEINKMENSSESIEMQLILPNEILNSKYDFKNLTIEFENDGFLEARREKWSSYFNITTKFLRRYEYCFNKHKSILSWKRKSEIYKDLGQREIKPFIYSSSAKNINQFQISLYENKPFFFSDKSLLEQNYLNKILEFGYPFIVCPQEGEYEIGMMSVENESLNRVKRKLFKKFNQIKQTIHYIHDDAEDTEKLKLAIQARAKVENEKDDDNFYT